MTKRLLLIILALVFLFACSSTLSLADEAIQNTVDWDGNGSEYSIADCSSGIHWQWILTPLGGIEITEATLTVTYADSSVTVTDGVYSGQSGQGAYHFHVYKPDGGVVDSASADYSYTGSIPPSQEPFLTISSVECYTPEPGSICGYKFNDIDKNGERDPGDPGLENWTIELYKCINSYDIIGTYQQLDCQWEFIEDTQTAADGSYCFTDLMPGVYKVAEVQKSDWTQSAPAEVYYIVELDEDQDVINRNFGNYHNPEEELGSICGHKFNDANNNGAWDESEPALSGWTIHLDKFEQAGVIEDYRVAIVTSSDTADLGAYCFNELPAGTYRVSEDQQEGWIKTLPAAAYIEVIIDSNALNSSDNDFGNKQVSEEELGSICGHKFNDKDSNGKWDGADAGLENWTIELYICTPYVYDSIGTYQLPDCQWDLLAETQTAADGSYCFTDLVTGKYKVAEDLKSGWTQTAPGDGYYIVELAESQDVIDRDFGNYEEEEGDDDDGDDDDGDDDDGDDGDDDDGDDDGNEQEGVTTPGEPVTAAPALQPIAATETVTLASAALPFTGGNPMAFVYAGFVLTALGTALRRRIR